MDEGVDVASAYQMATCLRREGHLIRHVNRHALLQERWEERAALLAIPGGRSLAYEEALGEGGRERIYQYVERGGHYFGICAGAYFGCAAIDFERGHPLEINGVCHIPFYPGLAVGPALGLGRFSYETGAGAELADLVWEGEGRCQERSAIYYNGGPTFIGGERSVDVQVLARYARTDKPSIVQCHVGDGLAILCGVHPEYGTDLVDRSLPHIRRLWPELEQAEEGRRHLFSELIARLIR